MAFAALLAGLAGCATQAIQNTEQLLAAAGFQQFPADTPERQNQLALLPAQQLVLQEPPTAPEGARYVYADPELCHCLWLGDARAFQAFQQLAYQQRIADEYLRASQSWAEPWGPWGYWGPTVIVRSHHHHPHTLKSPHHPGSHRGKH